MRVYLHPNLEDRVRDITGKKLENMSIYYSDDVLIADKNSSIEIEPGTYKVKLKFEYTDGTIDVLEDEELSISNKDIKVTINYRKIVNILAALLSSPLTWAALVIGGVLGSSLLAVIIAFSASDKSRYYRKKGSSIFTLRYR